MRREQSRLQTLNRLQSIDGGEDGSCLRDAELRVTNPIETCWFIRCYLFWSGQDVKKQRKKLNRITTESQFIPRLALAGLEHVHHELLSIPSFFFYTSLWFFPPTLFSFTPSHTFFSLITTHSLSSSQSISYPSISVNHNECYIVLVVC